MVKPILTDQNILGLFNDGVLTPLEGNDGALKVVVQESTSIDTSDLKTIIRVPVVQDDVDNFASDYADGSQGMVKTIKTYKTSGQPSDTALLMTYKYEDATYPDFWTEYVETNTTIS